MPRLWPGVGVVEQVAPGLYVDNVGNLHLEVGQLLQFLQVEDTPANRAAIAKHIMGESQRALVPSTSDAFINEVMP